MLNLIVSIASDAFQAYCCYLAFKCFFDTCKFSKRGEIIAILLFFLQTTIPHLTANVAGITTIFSVLACMWFPFIYEGKIKNKLLSGIFVFALLVLAECLVAAFTGYLHLDFMGREEYFSVYAMVTLPLVEYFVVRIIQNFKNVRKGENLPILHWMISGLLPIFSLGLYILFYKQIHWNQIELVIFILILFLINIFVFFLYDSLIEHFKVKQEKDNLALQNQYQMKQLQLAHDLGEAARRQKHDFKKHFSMLSKLNREGAYQELEKYLDEIQEHIIFHQKFVESGNFVLDSILNYKIQEAMEEGITIETLIKIPTKVELSAYDMNIILANLIDNSIEAVKKIENKTIFICIEWIKRKLYIEIKNPYDGIVKKTDNYLTTKKDRINHGFGFKIIEEVVDRYKGTIKIKHTEKVFCVKICLILE